MDKNGHVFRKKLFGGFNRGDVSRYILSLAEERNAQAERADALEKAVSELQDEAERLRSSLDEALKALKNRNSLCSQLKAAAQRSLPRRQECI